MSDWHDDNQERKDNLPDLRLSAKFAAWDLKKIGEEVKKISNAIEDLTRAFRKFLEKGGPS